jgi:hypothetical protein
VVLQPTDPGRGVTLRVLSLVLASFQRLTGFRSGTKPIAGCNRWRCVWDALPRDHVAGAREGQLIGCRGCERRSGWDCRRVCTAGKNHRGPLRRARNRLAGDGIEALLPRHRVARELAGGPATAPRRRDARGNQPWRAIDQASAPRRQEQRGPENQQARLASHAAALSERWATIGNTSHST